MIRKILILMALLLTFGGQAAAKMKLVKNPQRKPVSEWRRVQQVNYFLEGKRQQMFGSSDRAYSCFKVALLFNPLCDGCYYELSSLYAANRNYAEAAIAAQNAYMLDTSNFWYALRCAQLLPTVGRFDFAEELYWKCLAQKPKQQDVYEELLDMYGMVKNYDKQLSLLDYYEQYFGQDAASLMSRQQAYYKMGDAEKSIEAAVLLTEKFPSTQQYCLMAAELYLQQGQDSLASEYFQRARDIDSTSVEYQMSYADYCRRTERFTEYFAVLQKAFANPQASLQGKLHVLQFIQQFPQFAALYSEEISDLYKKTRSDSVKNFNLDYLYIQFMLQNRHWDTAQNEMYTALERSLLSPPASRPEQQALYNINLTLYSLLGEMQQWDSIIAASDRYGNALEIKYFPYYFKAFALSQKGNYPAAKSAAKIAIKHLNYRDSATVSQVHALLGDICLALNEYSQSDKSYEKALKYRPRNALLLNNYAYHLSLRGKKLKKALQMSGQSLLQDPTNATYLDTYAWILFKQKKYEEARQIFRKAIMYNGDKEPTILEHYGDTLFELGEKDNAQIYWKKARELGNGSPELDKKINK